MVTVESDGRLVFEVHAPDATSVHVVGAFTGWHEERLRMIPIGSGWWHLEFDPGPGEYLFRYLVDGACWIIDDRVDDNSINVRGAHKNRVWRPSGQQLRKAA